MKTHLTVIPADRAIIADGRPLYLDIIAPDNLHALQWHNGEGHVEFTGGAPHHYLTVEDYEREVAPYARQWEAEKKRLEDEANRPPSLEEAREAKLAEINAAFTAAEASGHVPSALGFEIDANPTAYRNVDGIIKSMEALRNDEGAEELRTIFCDYHNIMRPVTLEQVRHLQLEIIAHGQRLYARKWALREAANAAETLEALRALRWEDKCAA